MRESTVQISTDENNPIKIEPELTSKAWKKLKIVGWCVILVGLFFGPIFAEKDQGSGIGFLFLFVFIGVVILIIASIGAWYADKRTR